MSETKTDSEIKYTHFEIVNTDSKLIHISHLYHYISAFVPNKEDIEGMVEDINIRIKKAKEFDQPDMAFTYDLAGIMTLVITKYRVHLMLPYKSYIPVEEKVISM